MRLRVNQGTCTLNVYPVAEEKYRSICCRALGMDGIPAEIRHATEQQD